MVLVAQQKLQRVPPQRQGDGRFRLPGTEVQVVEVVGYGLVERGQLTVDQQMVMAGIGLSMPAGATPMLVSPKRIVAFCASTDPSWMPTK